MKIRRGLVSNSSSCSFVINLDRLTEDQIQELHNLYTRREEIGGMMKIHMSMDNGEIPKQLNKMGIEFISLREG